MKNSLLLASDYVELKAKGMYFKHTIFVLFDKAKLYKILFLKRVKQAAWLKTPN